MRAFCFAVCFVRCRERRRERKRERERGREGERMLPSPEKEQWGTMPEAEQRAPYRKGNSERRSATYVIYYNNVCTIIYPAATIRSTARCGTYMPPQLAGGGHRSTPTGTARASRSPRVLPVFSPFSPCSPFSLSPSSVDSTTLPSFLPRPLSVQGQTLPIQGQAYIHEPSVSCRQPSTLCMYSAMRGATPASRCYSPQTLLTT